MRQSPITHRIPRYMPGDAFFVGRRTPRAFVPLRSTAGRRPLQREALSLRGAKRRGNPFSPCLPLRGRWQREALTEGELSYGFPLPQSAAPTAPLPEGALQRGSAALTGRRTPRAFVPLRSTAGRRPLRSGLPHPSVGRAKFFAKPETFPGRWVYDIRKAFHPSKKENPL